MNNIKNTTTLGIAGSTSLDGLGLALMETDGIDVYRQGPAFVIPYEEELLEQIRSVLGKRADSPEHAAEIRRAETVFTEFAAAAVKDFVREEGVSPDILGFAPAGGTDRHKNGGPFSQRGHSGRRTGGAVCPGVLRGADGQNAASAGGN